MPVLQKKKFGHQVFSSIVQEGGDEIHKSISRCLNTDLGSVLNV